MPFPNWTLIACPADWRTSAPRVENCMFVDVPPEALCFGRNTAIAEFGANPASSAAGGASLLSNLGSPRVVRDDLVPQFLISPAPEAAVYSATIHVRDTLYFLNTYTSGLTAAVRNSPERLLEFAINAHAQHAVALDNHNTQNSKLYKHDPDGESEYKLTFETPIDPWPLANKVFARVAAGRYPGFVLHATCPFTTWRFDNFLFAVTAPAEEVGYVSFIPCPFDRYVVKRKVYAEDTLRRTELRWRDVMLRGSFADHLGSMLPGCSFSAYPQFHRTRFDIDLESVETGNHFSIMFDECVADGCNRLFQCEIEYMQSRSVAPSNMAAELREITTLTREYLEEQGAKVSLGFYSKLSWLRDTFNAGAAV